MSEIVNAQIDHAKDLDVVMPMYNLIEYSHDYLKTSAKLWQYCGDITNDILTNSKWFKFKIKIIGKTSVTCNTKDVKIVVPLKYLSNFWRTLEMPLINCKINVIVLTDFLCNWKNNRKFIDPR